jgi:large subunit ribosomal protein L30e
MAKKETDKNIDEIKKLLKSKKLILGTKVAMKELRASGLAKLFVASNAPQATVESIGYYSGMNQTQVVRLDYPNTELGALCKKPFSVSIIGIRK